MTEITKLHQDQEATIRAKVNSCSEGKTKAGSLFLSLNLEDLTETITAKIWDAKEETIEVGKVYEIQGVVNEYNGKLQFIIKKYTEVTNEDILEKYYKSAPVERKSLVKDVSDYISKIEDAEIRLVVETIFDKYEDELYSYPAATQNHHAYVNGLAFHSLTMLKQAEAICDIYDFLDRSLLYAGCLLHDFAKVIELSAARSPIYTMKGQMLGHLVMGSNIIGNLGEELGLPEEKTLLLQHMIISHHGRKEWGSPQRPMIAEAEVLFFIDSIDSKLESIRLEFENTKVNDWTKRIPVLEGRSIYRHKN